MSSRVHVNGIDIEITDNGDIFIQGQKLHGINIAKKLSSKKRDVTLVKDGIVKGNVLGDLIANKNGISVTVNGSVMGDIIGAKKVQVKGTIMGDVIK